MQLLVRNVTSRFAAAGRITEPATLAAVAVLLLAIAVTQYRSLVAWGAAESERSTRRWSTAGERAAARANATVSDLYAAVVRASQRNELGDAAALSRLFDQWRGTSELGSIVDVPRAAPAGAASTTPFAASWIPPAASRLPALTVSLPAGGTVGAVSFSLSPDTCDRLRETIAKGRVSEPLPEVEIAIAPAVGDMPGGCASRGYDARRPSETTAAIFRLGLPGRPGGSVGPRAGGIAGVVASGDMPGVAPQWRLHLQRRGEALAEVLASSRQRTLWSAAATQGLLVAAVAVVAIAGWRSRRRARAHLALAAAIAHELRTPLAALKVLGQNQARGIVTGEEQLAQYGRAVASEADRLHAFVERVLQFASGRAGVLPCAVAPIDCGRLAHAALEPLQDRLRQSRLDVRTVLPIPPPRVLGDEPSLVLALRNLLQNVLDHAEGARHLDLTVAVRGRYLEFTVADDGAGLPPQDRRRLFEPFVRGRAARQRRTPGQGLGLAIVADVAALHHGRAWCEWLDGRAVFGFRIRIDAEARVAA